MHVRAATDPHMPNRGRCDLVYLCARLYATNGRSDHQFNILVRIGARRTPNRNVYRSNSHLKTRQRRTSVLAGIGATDALRASPRLWNSLRSAPATAAPAQEPL